MVEVAPAYDVAEITALAGATLAHDELYLLGLARERAWENGDFVVAQASAVVPLEATSGSLTPFRVVLSPIPAASAHPEGPSFVRNALNCPGTISSLR